VRFYLVVTDVEAERAELETHGEGALAAVKKEPLQNRTREREPESF